MTIRSAFVIPTPYISKQYAITQCNPCRSSLWPILTTPSRQRNVPNPPRMESSIGKPSLYAGIAILAAVLTNRLILTPLDSLAMTQSRSDILGVITGATLVLYGVGKVEIADGKQAVEIGGMDVTKGFNGYGNSNMDSEIEWAVQAIFKGLPNVRSFAFVVNGEAKWFMGRFRNEQVEMTVVRGGIVEGVMNSGQRAYLADMKVVPVKETEFVFLPSNCQAVVIQPITKTAAFILGADKPRPLTGPDFGWIQAIANRLADVLESDLNWM